MAAIRDVSVIARTWATVTPQRTAQYEAGVKSPLRNWEAATMAAKEAWKTGVQNAVTKGLFEKGVKRAGQASWQEGAIAKGVPRWGAGVALAETKYERGFKPYRDAIAGVNLPPRFARRSPQNMARVAAIVDVMIATKERLAAGS